MNSLTLCKNAGKIYFTVAKRFVAVSANRLTMQEIIDPPENLELAILNYEKRRNDPIDVKKARLLYQSRKRGMLENGILLSSFAHKYLSKMNDTQIDEYDKIINLPSNDWDIFYWAMGMRPIPEEFDNGVMQMLKEHTKNSGRDARIGQPPLGPE